MLSTSSGPKASVSVRVLPIVAVVLKYAARYLGMTTDVCLVARSELQFEKRADVGEV